MTSPRSIRIEACVAVICALVGAKIDPDLVVWIFHPVDIVSCALAAIAFYFVFLLILDARDEGWAAFRARASSAIQRPRRGAKRAAPEPSLRRHRRRQGATP